MESVVPVTRYLLYYCAILLRNVTISPSLFMVAANANSYMI